MIRYGSFELCVFGFCFHNFFIKTNFRSKIPDHGIIGMETSMRVYYFKIDRYFSSDIGH